MSRVLTATVVHQGNVYAVGTSESGIPQADKIVADVWDRPADGAGETDGYVGWKVDDLAAEAEKRGLTVEGSGKDGKVVKADLVAALDADDKG